MLSACANHGKCKRPEASETVGLVEGEYYDHKIIIMRKKQEEYELLLLILSIKYEVLVLHKFKCDIFLFFLRCKMKKRNVT